MIDSASGQVHETLLALHNLDALEQRRALQHHVLGHVEYDAGLQSATRLETSPDDACARNGKGGPPSLNVSITRDVPEKQRLLLL